LILSVERSPGQCEWKCINQLLEQYYAGPGSTHGRYSISACIKAWDIIYSYYRNLLYVLYTHAGANVDSDGHLLTPSTMSLSTPLSATSEPSMSSTMLKHSTPRRGTNSNVQTNDIPPKPPNNLDVALQSFIGKFIPSESTKLTVVQILRAISHNAESL
jgi:hypothetical protein